MASQAVVIVNPRSQNGALGKKWPDLARIVGRELGGFDTRFTAAPGDATRLTRAALEDGAERIIAVGGDGTIHEVVNGFFATTGGQGDDRAIRPGAALGILPFGTGGDFRKTVKLPKDSEGAARVLAADRRQRIDLGVLEYHQGGARGPLGRCYFINIASFGIGGLVDQIVNTSSKRLGGRLSFLVGTARAALRYRNQKVRLEFDQNPDDFIETTINNVAIANGQYFGGGMHIAPEAELDDGRFDVVVLGDLTTTDFLLNGHRVYLGKHLAMDKVTCRRASRVDARPVNADEDVRLDVDGEAPGVLPARFRLLPKALDLVVP
jgi:YegS/Rv2252/BmrU family lipid kinase